MPMACKDAEQLDARVPASAADRDSYLIVFPLLHVSFSARPFRTILKKEGPHRVQAFWVTSMG
jgi:hypothetical protein